MFVKKIRALLSRLKPTKHKSAQEYENVSGEDTMVTLSEEIIIVEILARLPPKSLLRFKCVCKAWRSLVSDSKFIQMHLSRAIESDRQNLLLASEPNFVPRKCKLSSWDAGRFYAKKVKYIPQTPIEIYQAGDKFNEAVEIRNPLKPSLDRYHVMGSCNGLICMYSETSLCLFNPATGEYKLVQLRENIHWTNSFGFGYDAGQDDYKFVRVVAACSPQNSGREWDHSIVEIYSIRDCIWSGRPATSNIPYRVTSRKDACIFLNETFHWVADTKFKRNSSIILSFNLKDKVFREVPHPYDNVCVNKTDGVTLGTLRGKLCMLVGKLCDSEIEIWVMNNYGVSDSWTKLCSMEHTVIPSLRRCQYCFFLSHIRPLHILKNGEILIKDGSGLVLYNPKEKTSRNLKMQGIAVCNKIGEIATYTETLVSLKFI